MSKSVYIYTYGCQMNVHDSEKMLGTLSAGGYIQAEKPENADLIIFNTCAIRDKAEQKFYSQLGRIKLLKNKRNYLKIAVAGCVAQSGKSRIQKKAPFVDIILGPQNIHLLNDALQNITGSTFLEDNEELAAREVYAERQSTLKAWISIMYGCNNFCSYCIVPFTRGREVSRPSRSILSEVRNLASRGYKEITLLGQNVNSYTSDLSFSELLRKIDDLNIKRVRFVTSHPRDFSLDLVTAMSELPSVCEHIHLPLQSGSDRILTLMNRGYNFMNYKEKIGMIRSKIPNVAITTDIITGFPGETDDDHMKTLKAIKDIEYDGIFAFKYSPRSGTKACMMDGHVSESLKSSRLTELLETQEEITLKKNTVLEGTIQEVLLDGYSETDSEMLVGRTRTNKIVNVAIPVQEVGSIMKVKIDKAHLHSLLGKRLLSE